MGRYNLDPELREIGFSRGGPDLDQLEAVRAEADAIYGAAVGRNRPAGLEVRDALISIGDRALAVRIYRPVSTEASNAGLLYIHGGGFVVGTLDTVDDECVEIAGRVGCVVISVDYRLAPEHPYPAALDDCDTAATWLVANAGSLGVDPARIGVFGSSAGGCLAAALTLRLRDSSKQIFCFQFLRVPVLDDRLESWSMTNFTDTPFWDRSAAERSWDLYLGARLSRGSASVPYYAAPARALDLSGLPPTYISAAAFDPIRDEDLEFASRLLRAGVTTELHCFPGTFHGSRLIRGAAVSMREEEEMISVLSRALAPAP